MGSMFTLFLGTDRVRSFREAKQADTAAYGRYFHAMLNEGMYLPPSQFEAAFLSLAHTQDDAVRMTEAALASLEASLQ